MRHASLFLVTLLLAEALLPPASASLLMLFLPIRTAIFAYRSFRFAMRMRAFMRTVMLARRILRLMLNRQDKFKGLRLGSILGLAQDTCLHRLICEMNGGLRHKRRRHIATHRKNRNFMDPEERVAITFKVSNLINSCEKRFKSCPYNSKDMLQALQKFGTVWKDLKLPSMIKTRLPQE